jgi:hypothetical protein
MRRKSMSSDLWGAGTYKSLVNITAIVIAIFILILTRLVVQTTKDIMYSKFIQAYLSISKTSVAKR